MAVGNLLNLNITGTTHKVVASAPSGAVALSLPASVQIDTAILDSNANTVLGITAAVTSVNNLSIKNGATGAAPGFVCTGADTDVGIDLETQNAGAVQIFSTGTNPGRLNLFNSAVTANVGISAPVTVTGTYTMFLPGTQGAASTVMQNDGAGNLSWVANGSMAVVNQTATAVTMAPATTYVNTSTANAQVTYTLPTTAVIGATFRIIGKSTGGWVLQAAAGQTVQAGQVACSTAGTWTNGGNFDSVEIMCITANTVFSIISGVTADLAWT